MALQVFCRNCAQYRREWCNLKVDSPDPDMVQDCQYYKSKTNADKIRQMSDEELADFLWSIGSSPFNGYVYINGKPIFFTGNGNRWLDWLEQEVSDD